MYWGGGANGLGFHIGPPEGPNHLSVKFTGKVCKSFGGLGDSKTAVQKRKRAAKAGGGDLLLIKVNTCRGLKRREAFL